MKQSTLLLITLSSLTSYPSSFAYRTGDAIGILLQTHTPSRGNAHLEPYRHQLPRFGVSTKARFDVLPLLHGEDPSPGHTILNGENLRMSISFDQGMKHIPWLDVYNSHNQHELESLVITFVYSGSDGSIHAMHRQVNYRDVESPQTRGGMPDSFVVEYIWIEEADVDLRGGMSVLFLCVLFVVLNGMLGARPGSQSRDRAVDDGSSSFEGFAKRL